MSHESYEPIVLSEAPHHIRLQRMSRNFAMLGLAGQEGCAPHYALLDRAELLKVGVALAAMGLRIGREQGIRADRVVIEATGIQREEGTYGDDTEPPAPGHRGPCAPRAR